MADYQLTPEQDAIVSAYRAQRNLVIEAGAGTGKTSTLEACARAVPQSRVSIVVFNRSIAEELNARMPENVGASTAHSLAMRAVGSRYRHKLDRPRMKSAEVAKILGIDPIFINAWDGPRRLSPGWCAGHVMNGCMMSIVESQTHLQRVWVGDSQQQIYSWNGAVNALAKVDRDQTLWLTKSFRFGPAIAAAANIYLELLDSQLRIEGHTPIESTIDSVQDPDVVLARTNGWIVSRAFRDLEEGRRPAIVGGAKDVAAFARAAGDLIKNGWTSHRELSLFKSWDEVEAYVEDDPAGSDLTVKVRLIGDYGWEPISKLGSSLADESRADRVYSTAHKAKGREWAKVRLADDFPDDAREAGPEEVRLLYVAATRAKQTLDPGTQIMIGGRNA